MGTSCSKCEKSARSGSLDMLARAFMSPKRELLTMRAGKLEIAPLRIEGILACRARREAM